MGLGPEGRVQIAPLEQLVAWARGHSLWPLSFGIACCAIEMMTSGSARYDTDRYGIFYRGSPRQSDAMIVAGTITPKMAQRIERLYAQIAEPKYVIAMGACAISGGPFAEGYNVVAGVGQIVPVDIYVPGCPPRPEALMHAFLTLQERIAAGEPSAAERFAAEQTAGTTHPEAPLEIASSTTQPAAPAGDGEPE
jgi:NADH-quinone oxidoreductase subunit B